MIDVSQSRVISVKIPSIPWVTRVTTDHPVWILLGGMSKYVIIVIFSSCFRLGSIDNPFWRIKFDTALKDQWKPIKMLCRSNCKAGTAYDMVEVPKGRVNAYLPNHYHSLRVLIFANNNILSKMELLKKSPWWDSVVTKGQSLIWKRMEKWGGNLNLLPSPEKSPHTHNLNLNSSGWCLPKICSLQCKHLWLCEYICPNYIIFWKCGLCLKESPHQNAGVAIGWANKKYGDCHCQFLKWS